ncbi:MAG: hypothetical protein LBP28_04390 [Coriobacteriales bacterium]|jgi:signal transduction histidine kinase|nr:hypothetical protein [Coriobacteriales bacterium]
MRLRVMIPVSIVLLVILAVVSFVISRNTYNSVSQLVDSQMAQALNSTRTQLELSEQLDENARADHALQPLIEGATIGVNGGIFVLDSSHKVIADSANLYLDSDVSDQPWVGTLSDESLLTFDFVYGTTPVRAMTLRSQEDIIVAYLPISELEDYRLAPLVATGVIGGFGLIILLLLASFAFNRAVSRPLDMMAAQLEGLQSGQRIDRQRFARRPEIDFLGQTLNDTLDRLERADASSGLRAAVRTPAPVKVSAATQAVAAAQAAAAAAKAAAPAAAAKAAVPAATAAPATAVPVATAAPAAARAATGMPAALAHAAASTAAAAQATAATHAAASTAAAAAQATAATAAATTLAAPAAAALARVAAATAPSLTAAVPAPVSIASASELTDFGLEQLFHRVVSLIRPQLQQKALHFSVWIDKEVPNQLRGDERQIAQALLDLLVSTIATTPQRGHIQCTSKLMGAKDDGCVVRIGVYSDSNTDNKAAFTFRAYEGDPDGLLQDL